MIPFERYINKKGYIKYVLNMSSKKYTLLERYSIPELSHLDHRYINKEDKEFIDLINRGLNFDNKEFTPEIIKRQIIFGCGNNGVITLISPRPKIRIFRIVEGKSIIENESSDDSMNLVLERISFDKIFNAMFNKSKTIIIKSI